MQRFFLAALFLGVISCGPRVFLKKELAATERDLHEHVGFMLYDPLKRKPVFEYNSAQYSTPASNTKIFTLYTGLHLLGDSLVSLKYLINGDSLIFWGAGDPSFLYKSVFQNDRAYAFLKNAKHQLYFSPTNFVTDHFGPGWAWDDYPYSYSAERSPFPIYGNCLTAELSADSLKIVPPYFSKQVKTSSESKPKPDLVREISSNQLTYFKSDSAKDDSWEIPFHTSTEVLVDLLSDTLKRKVGIVNRPITPAVQTIRSVPVDSVYRVMMQASDNFIAEQILLASAAMISDTLNPEIAIRFMKKNHLADLADEVEWVDGSGLSRFNLFTPRNIVGLWEKIYHEVPRERLFKILPAGGRSGTLKNAYKADEPYIFGKTGSLNNNITLSGFLITGKGKTLLFSFMNANYITSPSTVRKKMEKVLRTIRDRY